MSKLLKTVEVVPEFAEIVEMHDGYCPCAVFHNEDTKCPCKAFRDQDEPGPCYCGRYEKVDLCED